MCIKGLYDILLILLFCIIFSNAYYIDFFDYEQEFNPEMVKYLNIRLVNATTRNIVNATLMYRQDLDKFNVKFVITSFNRQGKLWTLMNVTVDGCEYIENFFRKRKKFPYIFLSELHTTNPDLPKKCPLKKDKEIIVRNFYFRLENTYINFPEISFRFMVHVKQRGVDIFKIRVNGMLKN